MRRGILFAVILALTFAFVGCSGSEESKNTSANSEDMSTTTPSSSTFIQTEQTEQAEQTQQPQQTPSTNNSTVKKPADKKAVEEPYIGQWQIVKELAFAPASTYSNDDIKAIIGKKLTLSKESATCFGDKAEYLNNKAVNPDYKKTVISKEDFEMNNRVTFDKLGITGDSITQIDAADAKGNGATFFIKDNNTLILSGGGVFFELKRVQASADNSPLGAYKAVLQNKAEFFSTDDKKKLYLNDFLTNNGIYDITFKATKFAVLDMDGDNTPEVVLELSSGDLPSFYEVLHYMNNTVYGYIFTYRSLTGLKADGTFMYSSGAADNGVGKLKFGPDAYSVDVLGCIKSSEGDADLIISYFIGDKEVTKEEYDAFIDEQIEKKDAVWYEFSQEDIESKLSVKS